MTAPTRPRLTAGRVYRTRELREFGANPPRLAKRLAREGQLMELAHGLYVHPKESKFGAVPPTDEEIMRAFLDGTPYVFTGPDRWNALGLGSTGVFALPLVYNTKRSGDFEFGGRRFLLRRVAFPEKPSREWFAVDLLEHADQVSASRDELARALARSVKRKEFHLNRLREMMMRYASKRTRTLIEAALEREGL